MSFYNSLHVIICNLLFLANISVVSAQEEYVPKNKLNKITDNICTFTGDYGNATVLYGDDGILFVDSKNPALFDDMLKQISVMCTQPVKYLINTHWHGDHVGGNSVFAELGALIIAQENTLKHLSSKIFMEYYNGERQPIPVENRPVITFSEEIKLYFDNEEVEMKHYIAHTDGDAVVYFKNANVISVGDIYFSSYYPYIGIEAGGSINYMIDAIAVILENIDDNTIIIPGHGPISNKKGFSDYHHMLIDIRDNIQPQINAGKSLEEIQQSKPTQKYDDPWGIDFLGPEGFVKLVYMDLIRFKK
ncbi:MAG: hypothetical protein A2V66_15215 [Ignavibacteria bacterium RBG_13_36_8]|nr:MAG: hypothetical protein A2V66_15215 [Ignavibacteria bacterium RBG_13_36_8]